MVIGYGGGDRQLSLKARKGLPEEIRFMLESQQNVSGRQHGQQVGEAGQGTISAVGDDV